MSAKTAIETARRGRPCSVCRHPDRAQLESQLSTGEHSLRAIARQYDLAPENVRRHVRGHVAPEVRQAMIAVAGTPALSIAARLLDVADSARDARLAAEEAGDDRLAALMGQSEARTLDSLVRMGVTSADVASSIHDAHAVMQVFGTVAREHPEVVDAMVDVLDRRNQTAWADQIKALAAAHLETKAEAHA